MMKPRQEQIMSLLRGHAHGLRCADIALAIGLGKQRTAEWLRSLRKLGMVLPTADGGRDARWALPHISMAIRAERERMSRKERNRLAMVRQRRIARLLAEGQRLAQEQAEERAFLAHPTHSIVPAAQAEPIRPQRPASVFMLAS